jgi:hypothetical protein
MILLIVICSHTPRDARPQPCASALAPWGQGEDKASSVLLAQLPPVANRLRLKDLGIGALSGGDLDQRLGERQGPLVELVEMSVCVSSILLRASHFAGQDMASTQSLWGGTACLACPPALFHDGGSSIKSVVQNVADRTG